MHLAEEEEGHDPLKRSFSDVTDDAAADQGPPKRFRPRRYQTQVYEVARKRNTIAVMETGTGKTMIAVMETGTGKTMIAVMLIDEIGQAIKSSGGDKLMIFLAPTVHLVHQQFGVIKEHTGFEVEEYYGAKGVDAWDKEHWEKEFKNHDILVMTPQILLDALRKAFLTMETILLLIMDECHRATGNHPYTKIMMEFYHKSNMKPKVFGMTASPVIRKGVSSTMDCEDQISELESLLDSQIYTIEDKTEMEVYAPAPKETHRLYNPTWFSSLDVQQKIKVAWEKNDTSFTKLQESIQSNFKDLDEKVKTLRRRLSNDYEKILYCLDDLGLICAYVAAKVCLENAPTSEDCEVYRESSLLCRYFLEEAVGIIKHSLSNGVGNFLVIGFDYLKAVDLGYISPKLNELVQLFQSFGVCSDLLCLIFVDRIITAKVIERFMRKVTSLSHFKISYFTGSTTSVDALTPKIQKETLKLFSSGVVNLLFSTDVEEGIHVPNCSCVIRFDLPKTVRSYVQSRGRARQDNFQFILMLERGNEQQRNHLYDIIKSEGLMTNTALNRDPDEMLLKPCTLDEVSSYTVDATGASVTADSSVRLIHKYCDTLPRDKYFIPKPAYQFSYLGDSYDCKITLPPNAAFQTLVGPACKNSALAKQAVCLEACKKLHELGGLNDHLLPSTDKPLEKDVNTESKGPASGAGTTKRKELHGTTSIHTLSGTWAEKLDGAVFYAYKFDFSCDIATELYSGLVLLIETELAEDVGNIELDLYLLSKKVKASVSLCGQVHLDEEQMTKAKLFQEFYFNGLFGKLFHRINPVENQTEFLLAKQTRKLWSQSYMYLLLPLDTSNYSNNESWKVNWDAINSCVSMVEFLKHNALLGAQHCNSDATRLLQNRTGNGCNGSQIFHFADSSVNEKSLEDMVVVAIHTGKIYSIFEILSDTSAESPFDTSEYNNYADYFKRKYGVLLNYPGQPLLRLKQNHNPHNLLVNFNGKGGSGKTSESGRVVGKERMYAYMPPELLVCTGMQRDVLKSFYLIPSLMHRLESLMLASQLREQICDHPRRFHISSSLILEALTSLRCSEDFSMERLELLGDSVLKYTVGCHFFLKYPEKHDGQLSSLRQSVICNANLHRVGIDRNIQGYVQDGAFDPRRWVGPGQISIWPVPCECGVDTREVPLDIKFQTSDRQIVVGKCCDKGHRWIGSKTISDCVEALIGAYYVAGGLSAAVHFMKWLKIDVELEPSLVSETITTASLHSLNPLLEDDIGVLESKLRYVFSTKGLLQEAITHASEQESKLGYSYERLEYLGDCVLDLLITRYLYESHKDIDPGELTDLRAASVNNENFAQAAVRHNLQQHLQHCSGLLQSQISEYVKSLSQHNSGSEVQGVKGPKALGDMVESIAGAILIDTKLNIDELWRVYEPLLSPIVTPEKLELPPLRELIELCGSLGYFYKESIVKKAEAVHAELSVQLKEVLLVGKGVHPSKKAAKGEAAHRLLKELEKRGVTHSRSSKKRKPGADQIIDTTPLKQKKTETHLLADSTEVSSPATVGKISSLENDIPVIKAINMNKGGPRVSLFELCRKQQWQMPTFKLTEKNLCFTSTITLYIPNMGNIECTGDPRPDKKSSLDSAALLMLYNLEQQGRIIIGGC